MTKATRNSSLGTTLGRYFKAKYKFWYVVALNNNVDSDIIVDGSLRCMRSSNSLRDIIRYVERFNNAMIKKGIIFTVIKSPLYVPEGTKVQTEKAAGIVNTNSPLWASIAQYATAPFDGSGLNQHEMETIKVFATNEVV